MTFFAKNLQRTKTGRVFVAIRDNDLAAQVMLAQDEDFIRLGSLATGHRASSPGEWALAGLEPVLVEGTSDFATPRFVFAEFFRLGPTYAAFDGRFSLIYKQTSNRFEMFDGKKDPEQRRNIYHTNRSRLMEAVLRKHIRESMARLKSREAKETTKKK